MMEDGEGREVRQFNITTHVVYIGFEGMGIDGFAF